MISSQLTRLVCSSFSHFVCVQLDDDADVSRQIEVTMRSDVSYWSYTLAKPRLLLLLLLLRHVIDVNLPQRNLLNSVMCLHDVAKRPLVFSSRNNALFV